MLDVTSIVEGGGLLLIALIIFAESGMFVGFFFPGDTLLMAAGIFAAQGHFSVELAIAVIACAAILGDNTGYHIGKRYGRRLFKKDNSIFFRKEYADQAEKFFERYGTRTMLFAHYVPVVRTFAPPVAGTAQMDYKKFFIFDAVGDIVWASSITLVGYWFGQRIPNLSDYVEAAVLAVVALTLGPAVYHFIKAVRNKNKQS